jgi:hypothetical protein
LSDNWHDFSIYFNIQTIPAPPAVAPPSVALRNDYAILLAGLVGGRNRRVHAPAG